MMTGVESGESAPTLAFPRKRERGPTDTGARESLKLNRVVSNRLSSRQSLLPLPLAGEGRGGGCSTAGAKL
jgi:hypothetical protein